MSLSKRHRNNLALMSGLPRRLGVCVAPLSAEEQEETIANTCDHIALLEGLLEDIGAFLDAVDAPHSAWRQRIPALLKEKE